MLSCSNGVKVSVDKYNYQTPPNNIYESNEQLLFEYSFLDRKIDQAFDTLTELLATPNFDEPTNIADMIKFESVNKANMIGNKALQYANSYASSGLK